jgi:hypothetical protein
MPLKDEEFFIPIIIIVKLVYTSIMLFAVCVPLVLFVAFLASLR